MATLVFFHAHPDDEAIGTAGTMLVAALAGHRVVSLFATRGERGELPADLNGHASLGALREAEARRAGEILGAARVEFLGYADSGSDGGPAEPGSFAAADVDEAARRLADLLAEESADALVSYDPTGSTKHPDHLQVHRVGRRAQALAGDAAPRLYEVTITAAQLARLVRAITPDGEPDAEVGLFATPDDEVSTAVDVRPWLATKRAAMAAHASQIPASSWFLTLSDDDFAAVWGREYYIDHSAHLGPGPLEAAVGRAAATVQARDQARDQAQPPGQIGET